MQKRKQILVALLFFVLSCGNAIARLDDSCIATILNRQIQVQSNGLFAIPNVPVPLGAFKVRFVCNRGGITETAQTFFLSGVANSETFINKYNGVRQILLII